MSKVQAYVCGFLFSSDRSRVLLIRKNRPAWQAGLLNGVGGKIEAGETPEEAMVREFYEEAGVRVGGWQECVVLSGTDWRGHFFRAFGDLEACRAATDEQLEVHSTRPLPAEVIPNLRWMIPLMMDDDPFSGRYHAMICSPEALARRPGDMKHG